MKREYIYSRTVTVKNSDGTESHVTMKFRTPHNETHAFCTNYGIAFTKRGDPSDTKFAMFDRSIAHLVRTVNGCKAHTDSEFRLHMAKPEQQRKLSIFRTMVCLIGKTRLVIKDVPALRPDLAFANRVFDHLNQHMLVNEYNLPAPQPRKRLKLEENLITLCCIDAVSRCFLYKQTASHFPSTLGLDSVTGLPRQFNWEMLYDVVRQLHPTPELIFMAWSMSLSYNVGTAPHSCAAMTAICESFGLSVGDWFRKVRDEDVKAMEEAGGRSVAERHAEEFAYHAPVLQGPATMESGGGGEQESAEVRQRRDKDNAAAVSAAAERFATARAKFAKGPLSDALPRGDPLVAAMGEEGMNQDERKSMADQLGRRRRALASYRNQCMKAANAERVVGDTVELIESVMRDVPPPADADRAAQATEAADSTRCMPLYSSLVMSDLIEASLIYSASALVLFCNAEARHLAVSDAHFGTCAGVCAKPGIEFARRTSTADRQTTPIGVPAGAVMGTIPPGSGSGRSGSDAHSVGDGRPTRWNTAWLTMDASDGWSGLARQLTSGSNTTCNQFDIPFASMRDLAFVLSTKDNSRRIAEEPKRRAHGFGAHDAFSPDVNINHEHDAPRQVTGRPHSLRMNPSLLQRQGGGMHRSFEYYRHTDQVKQMRDPYARMRDAELQRAVDVMIRNARLPALASLTSNQVQERPPLRLVRDSDGSQRLELSTAAAIEHTRLVAECCAVMSLVPGFSNKTEWLQYGAVGPAGLQAPVSVRHGSNPSTSGSGSAQSTSQDTEVHNRIPYSYDIVQAALTIDAMSRWVDDYAQDHFYSLTHQNEDVLKKGGLIDDVDVKKRRHMATRFPGLDRRDTLLVSMQAKQVRDKKYAPVAIQEEAELDDDDFSRTKVLLDAALGRAHTPTELLEHIRAREGARALPSMRAKDLFSTWAWMEHAKLALVARGMVSGNDDTLLGLIADAPYGLWERVAEAASQQLNAQVDKEYARCVQCGVDGHRLVLNANELRLPKERQESLLQEKKRVFRNGLFTQAAQALKLEHLAHYGPANLKPARTKLTYENQVKEVDASGLRVRKRKCNDKNDDAALNKAAQKKFVAFHSKMPCHSAPIDGAGSIHGS